MVLAAAGHHHSLDLPSWMADQPPRHVSTVLWGTGFVLLGWAAGRAYRTAERIAGQAGLALPGAIVVGASAALLIRRRRHARQPTAPPQGRR